MPLLYFIPTNLHQISAEEIRRLGLEYAIDHPTNRGCTGPDGRHGFLMEKDRQKLHNFDEQSQTWIPAPKQGADSVPYWVGYETLPTAEELQREELVDGEWIETTGGYRWLVPRLMMWKTGDTVPAVYHSNLPVCIDIDDDGNPIDGAIVPKYRDLFDIGLRVLTKLAGGNEEGLTSKQVITFAANCIGMNYRVSLLELSSRVLGCLSTEDAMRVIYSAVDWQGYQDAVGNWDGRQGRPTTDMESGSDKSTQANPTISDRPLAS
ncbi:hypothetical protein Mal15_21960 [Stieleria maiorica]|uniref:Uncharacterized protein n=1 Tax=Stieleria maiorica TaxID=2795974 RepID=A0A5B9MAI8_9BACT|nr:hypothetical protein [Stieleria maiorica]QEF98148.1 hypothetical protein Mal15_21960 [Stieleria maiorica]